MDTKTLQSVSFGDSFDAAPAPLRSAVAPIRGTQVRGTVHRIAQATKVLVDKWIICII
jgi:hypothetical protein